MLQRQKAEKGAKGALIAGFCVVRAKVCMCIGNCIIPPPVPVSVPYYLQLHRLIIHRDLTASTLAHCTHSPIT